MLDVTTSPTSSSKNKKYLIKIVIGIGLLTGVISLLPQSKVSRAFIDKFNDIVALQQEIKADSLLINTDGIKEKEQAKDYKGVVKIFENVESKTNNLATKVDKLIVKIGDFKNISEKVKDSDVRAKALYLADLLDQSAGHAKKLTEYSKELILLGKEYYQKLANGESASISEDEVNRIIAQIDAESKASSELSDKINRAEEELADAAGIKIKK